MSNKRTFKDIEINILKNALLDPNPVNQTPEFVYSNYFAIPKEGSGILQRSLRTIRQQLTKLRNQTTHPTDVTLPVNSQNISQINAKFDLNSNIMNHLYLNGDNEALYIQNTHITEEKLLTKDLCFIPPIMKVNNDSKTVDLLWSKSVWVDHSFDIVEKGNQIISVFGQLNGTFDPEFDLSYLVPGIINFDLKLNFIFKEGSSAFISDEDFFGIKLFKMDKVRKSLRNSVKNLEPRKRKREDGIGEDENPSPLKKEKK